MKALHTPFGMIAPGRSYSAGSGYRYGYNGKENDREVKGEGDQIAFENRIYDPRIGRWLSLDPLQKKYPGESHYAFVSGNPILYADKDGRDKIVTITFIGKDGTVTQIQRIDKSYFKYGKDGRYDGAGYYYWKASVYQNVTVDLQHNTASSTNNVDYANKKDIPIYEYSKASDWVNGVVNFFSSQTGDLSDTYQYGWRIYGKGHDMDWQKGLPTIAPGSDESIDLEDWLDIAEGMREGASPSDIAEKFGSKNVAGMAEKIEKISEGAGKVAEIIWKKKEDNEKKGKNEIANQENVGITCPACKLHENDSAHIDKVNGTGTYSRLKAAQSTTNKPNGKQ